MGHLLFYTIRIGPPTNICIHFCQDGNEVVTTGEGKKEKDASHNKNTPNTAFKTYIISSHVPWQCLDIRSECYYQCITM